MVFTSLRTFRRWARTALACSAKYSQTLLPLSVLPDGLCSKSASCSKSRHSVPKSCSPWRLEGVEYVVRPVLTKRQSLVQHQDSRASSGGTMYSGLTFPSRKAALRRKPCLHKKSGFCTKSHDPAPSRVSRSRTVESSRTLALSLSSNASRTLFPIASCTDFGASGIRTWAKSSGVISSITAP